MVKSEEWPAKKNSKKSWNSKKKKKSKNSGMIEKNRASLASMSRMFDQIKPEEVNDKVKDHLLAIHGLLLKIHRRRAHWEAFKSKPDKAATDKDTPPPPPPTKSPVLEHVSKVASQVVDKVVSAVSSLSKKVSGEKVSKKKSKTGKKSAK